MKKHANIDYENKELVRSFYRKKGSERVYYFTGEYDKKGYPIFEKDGIIIEDYRTIEKLVKKLTKVNLKDVESIIGKLKNRATWLENSLRSDRINEIRENYDNMKKGERKSQ